MKLHERMTKVIQTYARLNNLHQINKDMNAKFAQITSVILAGMVFIMALTVLTIGLITITYTANFHIASEYKTAMCTLTTSSTVSIGCVSNYYVATWSNNIGKSVVQSPFSTNRNKEYVDSQLNNYPFNVPIECLCRSDININYPGVLRELPCDAYAQCFLNIQVLDFMKNQQYLYNIGVTLIIMGIVGILILMTLFGILCFQRRKLKYAQIQDGVV